MTNHERLTEQYEDALFALLMDSVAEEEGKQALELNERLKADPAAEVPESARRRCEATIRREFNRKRAKKLGKVTWKVVRRVSVAVMLMVVLLTTAMAASEQFRLGVHRTHVQRGRRSRSTRSDPRRGGTERRLDLLLWSRL